jgi:hydrogenase maturation protein HypF
MGVAMLVKLGREGDVTRLFPGVSEAPRLAAGLRRGARVPVTTSLGRLFDAIAALAGVCSFQRYEGQAAMELEALVRAPLFASPSDWRLEGETLDLAPFAERVIRERPTPREAAEGFHAALVDGVAAWVSAAARASGRTRIALGGGCVMNRVLTEGLCGRLRQAGFEVALPRRLPANDGGISFGQAAFALQAGG